MCAIVLAYDVDTALELLELNSYRGQHSHSIAFLDKYHGIVKLHQAEGPVDKSVFDDYQKGFTIIGHVQAPTTQVSGIHPAVYHDMNNDTFLLWHNGIIKPEEIKRLQEKQAITDDWDTQLILKEFAEDNYTIDGSFACIMYTYPRLDNEWGHVSVFRNQIAPLFYSNRGFSSTKFKDSVPVPPDKVYTIFAGHPTNLWLEKEFTTVNNPYYFGKK